MDMPRRRIRRSPQWSAILIRFSPGPCTTKLCIRRRRPCISAGFRCLRFNFRGAGLSEGVHDNGKGEAEDVRAALDYLADSIRVADLLLAGFSFGSWVGLRVGCGDARVTDLIGLGIPANRFGTEISGGVRETETFRARRQRRIRRARENIEALFATVPEPKKLVFVDGADHFFTGQLDQVAGAINDWLDERHPAGTKLRSANASARIISKIARATPALQPRVPRWP